MHMIRKATMSVCCADHPPEPAGKRRFSRKRPDIARLFRSASLSRLCRSGCFPPHRVNYNQYLGWENTLSFGFVKRIADVKPAKSDTKKKLTDYGVQNWLLHEFTGDLASWSSAVAPAFVLRPARQQFSSLRRAHAPVALSDKLRSHRHLHAFELRRQVIYQDAEAARNEATAWQHCIERVGLRLPFT